MVPRVANRVMTLPQRANNAAAGNLEMEAAQLRRHPENRVPLRDPDDLLLDGKPSSVCWTAGGEVAVVAPSQQKRPTRFGLMVQIFTKVLKFS